MRTKNYPSLPKLMASIVAVIATAVVGVVVFMLYTPALAATGINETVNYQGRLLTSTGAVVPDGSYNMEFKIVKGGDGCNPISGTFPCSGTVQWTETRESGNKVLVKNGYFSVYLGSVTAFSGSVDWNDDTLWLGINIGGTGSPSYDGVMKPLTRLSSTPYALNTKYLGGIASTGFVQLSPSGTQTTSSATAAINVTQSSTGNILNLDASNASANGILIDVQSSSTSQYALSVTTNNGATQAVYVRADGNVGIGEVSPQATLHVDGTLRFEDFVTCTALETDADGDLLCGSDGGGAGGTLQDTYDGGAAGDQIIILDATQDSLIIRNPSATAGTDSAFTLQVDNIDTGLTIANFKNLNVTEAGSFDTTSASLTNYGGYFSNTSTRSAGSNNLTNVGLYATASGAQNNYAAIFESGNVGIGTSAPGEKLEVVGNIISKGTQWTSRTSAADNEWRSVTYGNGLFVAVACGVSDTFCNGTAGVRVMTSPDGISWISRTAASNNEWQSVTYGNGLFVAVSDSGTGNRVMTSPDGITWTSRTSALNLSWQSVTYGNGLFVAVSTSGSGNRVMTSPDGITWTSRTSAADNDWRSVTYGNGLFVAVSSTGGSNRVMTSPDGITWTIRTSAASNNWYSVTYGNSLFVAVGETGSGDRVMTSPDGITWTSRTSASDNQWRSVTYGNGLFVAVSAGGSGSYAMTSPDGIIWTSRASAADSNWLSVTYGNGLFVAVRDSGTGNRVMTSGKTDYQAIQNNNIYQGGMKIYGQSDLVNNANATTADTTKTLTVTIVDTGVVSSGTDNTYGGQISVTRTGATTGSTINTYGLDIQATGDAGGVSTLTGLNVNVSGADTNYAALFNGGNVGIGDASPAALLTVGSGDLFQVNSSGAIAAVTGYTQGSGTFSLTSATTTGTVATFTDTSFAPADAATANLLGLTFTDSSSNTSGTSTVNGLNVSPTVATTGATGAKSIRAVNAAAPAVTSCTGGNCTLVGLRAETLTAGAAANITSYGLLVDATGIAAGTLQGLNINSITGGAGTETAINIGTGWDNLLTYNGAAVISGIGVVQVAAGGTNITSYTIGDLLYASGATTLSKLADVATGSCLISGGVATAPSWGSCGTISTLKNAYDADTDTGDTIIELSTADDSLIIRNPSATAGTDSAFTLQVDNIDTGLTIANFKNLNVTEAGSFDTTSASLTNYGGYFSNTSTESAGANLLTNVGLYATATGADNNYAAIFESGNVGIGTTSPQQALTLGSTKNLAVDMTAPGTITDTGSITGGTLAAGTYYHKVTALDSVGDTIGSPESTCTIASGSTGSCAMSWTAITGASSYKVYRTTTSGSYGATSLVASTNTNSYTDTGSALVSGTPPIVTTAYVNKLTASGSSWLNGGNVGIGTSAPGEKLEVVGNIISKGTQWTLRTSAADNTWTSVTYGNGLFVAVACGISATACNSTAGNRVMTSPDGINWTSRASAANNKWQSVTYGNGLFVAVSFDGSGNRIMTSPDGITWTSRTTPADNQWYSVTYGNGLFVAVSTTGTGNRVMTSSDGITWTIRTSAADNNWRSVTYGNGLFVAVSSTGTGNRVMTSSDGITWTIGTSIPENSWQSVTYGNGLFVAVSDTGSGNRVMTSPDGITWTSRTSAADNNWYSVTYGNGLFVAVSSTGTGNRVMTSPDGITWTLRTSAADSFWQSVTYGNGLFVAVGETGTGNRVMTSGKTDYIPFSANNIYHGGMTVTGDFILEDAGSAFLTVTGTGAYDYALDGTDNPTYTITNNGSGNVITNLAGTGDFVIQDGGVQAFFVSDSGAIFLGKADAGVNVTIGDGSASTTPDLFVLDHKTATGDPSGSNGAMYYNAGDNKFRCYEAGAWKNCVTGLPDTARFQDTTAEALADADTADYWDGTYSNITPSSTSSTVLITVQFEWNSNGAGDINPYVRIVREDDAGSTTPSCDGTDPQVADLAVGFTTATNQDSGGSGTALDSPASALPVYYTVCSAALSTLGSAADTTEITVILVELGP